jgi:hypothetical protein
LIFPYRGIIFTGQFIGKYEKQYRSEGSNDVNNSVVLFQTGGTDLPGRLIEFSFQP